MKSSPSAIAFEDAYRLYAPRVFRYAVMLTGNRQEAEDIVAETFARYWRASLAVGSGDLDSLPWLLRVARNLSTDHWRRIARSVNRLMTPRRDDIADAELRAWVRGLIAALPPRQREVIALRFDRDLSYQDVAMVMGLTESGVRSLVGRAIANLRAHPELLR